MALIEKFRSPGAHWSQDCVEHLRTIHFTLLSLSIGLSVFILSSPSANIGKAEGQLEGIIGLQDLPQPWLTSADKFYREHYPKHPGILSTKETTAPHTGKELPAVVLTSTATGAFKFPAGLAVPFESVPPVFTTLSQFQQMWDKRKLDVLEIEDSPHILLPERDQPPANLEQVSSGKMQDSQIPDISWIAQSDGEAFFIEGVSPTCAQRRIKIRCSGHKRTIDVQAFFADRLAIAQGTFDNVFRYLSEAVSYREREQSLQSIQVKLLKEQLRSPENFQALGLTLSRSLVSRFGALMILGLQWYLILHLRELKGRLSMDDPGWNIAWIGFYKNPPARVTLYSSLLLLPPASLVALTLGHVFVLFMPFLSLVLALYTVALLPNKATSVAAAAFE